MDALKEKAKREISRDDPERIRQVTFGGPRRKFVHYLF
jgi:hypothetical protein